LLLWVCRDLRLDQDKRQRSPGKRALSRRGSHPVGDKKAEASPPPGARKAQSGPHGVAEPEQPGLTRSSMSNDQEAAFRQLRQFLPLDCIWILGVLNRPNRPQ
jgi:hypothetical protein